MVASMARMKEGREALLATHNETMEELVQCQVELSNYLKTHV